ncbi:hypothetical protein BD410DRAFT_783183 [Rickenella mellea]|uniref:Uncharacterized protein n=1 Tax=Rickenella mellea TaxID=50990 RepID=A0A4Y7QHA2_9AGAM|nr:hypothetical protein BD410DRAFT_783183 [Rickenella mellea]
MSAQPKPSSFKFWRKSQKGGAADPTALRPLDSNTSGTPSSVGTVTAGDGPIRVTAAMRHDMLTEFFGGRVTPAREAAPPSYASSRTDVESLPPYDGEYKTITRYMFYYGFLFPPLWLIAVIMLTVPLRPVPEWENTKTAAEQAILLARMRSDELKWGKRCLYALITLFAIVALISVVVYLALRHRH